MLLRPKSCHQYLDGSVVNIETYPTPCGNEVLDERMNNYIALYQTLERRDHCLNSMENAFTTKEYH